MSAISPISNIMNLDYAVADIYIPLKKEKTVHF